ncbi:MAG: undecaprenyl-diphosphate phosphatase [Gemmatimonadales bacterium]|nr:MAG: undecaprenyl-diphosphate phosphatase [Gemmatimonadales bacterium]
MTFWEAVLLGIIQGIFMFFPVSSTSHLVLMQHWLIERGSEMPSPESAEMIFFDLIVHVGTLVSMAVVFRKPLRHFLGSLFTGLGSSWKREGTPGDRERLTLKLAILGIFAVFMTGLIGFPLKAVFEGVFARPQMIAGTLVITGILLWWTDVLPRRTRGLREIGPGTAAVVGIAQGLALLPGLSRSGTTIAFGLFTGMKRRWAAEFSFFIAFPTILGASLLQFFELVRLDIAGNVQILPLLTGFVVAAVVGIGALHVVLHLLYRARFRYFSYYVWALAALILVGTHRGWLGGAFH